MGGGRQAVEWRGDGGSAGICGLRLVGLYSSIAVCNVTFQIMTYFDKQLIGRRRDIGTCRLFFGLVKVDPLSTQPGTTSTSGFVWSSSDSKLKAIFMEGHFKMEKIPTTLLKTLTQDCASSNLAPQTSSLQS